MTTAEKEVKVRKPTVPIRCPIAGCLASGMAHLTKTEQEWTYSCWGGHRGFLPVANSAMMQQITIEEAQDERSRSQGSDRQSPTDSSDQANPGLSAGPGGRFTE